MACTLYLMVHSSRYIYGTCSPLRMVLSQICRRYSLPLAGSNLLFIRIYSMRKNALSILCLDLLDSFNTRFDVLVLGNYNRDELDVMDDFNEEGVIIGEHDVSG